MLKTQAWKRLMNSTIRTNCKIYSTKMEISAANGLAILKMTEPSILIQRYRAPQARTCRLENLRHNSKSIYR